MKNMTLSCIASACGGRYFGAEDKKALCVESVTTDSRKACTDCLFIPIAGERTDGHNYIADVYKKGALCCLSERKLQNPEGPYILVESSLQAIKDIAEYYRKQLDIKVVGITGSVGKTSTKEIIFSVLSQKYKVLKTQGNFNNELGLPLTIFRLREEHEIAVLEMGISDFGEMHRLSKIARPDVCVITNIGYCHLENLKNLEGVLRAKTELFDFLNPNGSIILNGDDNQLASITDVGGITPVFFGIEKAHPIHADHIINHGLKGICCDINTGKEIFPIRIPIPGIHMVYNGLAAAAAGMEFGLNGVQIKAGIESLEPVSGRFHRIEREGLTIIDDCYNANPVSMKASLDVLSAAAGRKIAVLGDMGELGEDETSLHADVGAYAAGKQIDLLICVGKLSRFMAEAAAKAKDGAWIHVVKDKEELLEKLPGILRKDDTVLVKASHCMEFEKIVDFLTNIIIN